MKVEVLSEKCSLAKIVNHFELNMRKLDEKCNFDEENVKNGWILMFEKHEK